MYCISTQNDENCRIDSFFLVLWRRCICSDWIIGRITLFNKFRLALCEHKFEEQRLQRFTVGTSKGEAVFQNFTNVPLEEHGKERVIVAPALDFSWSKVGARRDSTDGLRHLGPTWIS